MHKQKQGIHEMSYLKNITRERIFFFCSTNNVNVVNNVDLLFPTTSQEGLNI